MEWINVNDRLPAEEGQKGVDVTVYIVDEGMIYIGDGCYDSYFWDGEFTDPTYGKYKLHGVTHWMKRIPKPIIK